MAGENRTYLGDPKDKQYFIELVKELQTAFKPHGYVLSAAVSAGKPTVDIAYDVKQLNDLLDFINVMTYDFHGAWENKTGNIIKIFPLMYDQFDIYYLLQHITHHFIPVLMPMKKTNNLLLSTELITGLSLGLTLKKWYLL